MKKLSFVDTRIVDALKRAKAEIAVSEIYREFGINAATPHHSGSPPQDGF